MYVKKLKRKCSVRGCKCTDTYAISLTREIGNSVIVCKSCLEKAVKAVEGFKPAQETDVKAAGIPALFFNSTANAPVEPVEPVTEEPAETPAETETDDTATTPADVTEFKCPYCGQVCKSEIGLQSHIRAKHKDEAEA